MGPCDLNDLLKMVPVHTSPELLMGLADSGDVGIYRVSDDLAIVHSVDFFPPHIPNAHKFGMITAANALSDIYAAGARPLTALNLLSSPKDEDPEILADILRGGHEKMTEAGGVIVGGHTIQDDSIKYGLAVTGVVHPDRIVRHDTPATGDVLLLTKPIGTGISISARSKEAIDDDAYEACIAWMCELNKAAGESMFDAGAHASTDVTGFGLIGHALQMIEKGKVGFRIDYSKIPILPGVAEFASQKLYPRGTKKNHEYFTERVDFGDLSFEKQIVMNDSQTSGGLLISIPAAGAEKLLGLLGDDFGAAVIGKVVAEHPGRIMVVH